MNTLALMRFISSIGLGSEYLPTRWRNTVLGILQAGWSVGYVLATIHGWRCLFIISIIPVVLAVLLKHFVPESPSWLATQTVKAKENMRVNLKQNALTYIFKCLAVPLVHLIPVSSHTNLCNQRHF